MKYGQPVISRETGRLLVTIAVSIAALWVLARIRFQERAAPQTGVAPVLAQLRPAASYDDLARAVADVRPLVAAAVLPAGDGSAFRIGAERAVALAPDGIPIVAADRATGLSVIAVATEEPAGVMPWMPRILDYPRFLLVAERAADTVAVRPVFVSTLTPVHSPYWDSDVWQLPTAEDFPVGRFVFTTEGALAGLIVAERGRRAIVPAPRLLDAASRLAASPPRPPGTLGVEVQPVSSALAAVLGVDSGVVVSAVDAAGPAADDLAPTDVIVAIDGRAIDSIDRWRARVLRVAAGDTVSLSVRSEGESRTVQIAAVPAAAVVAPEPAGNTLGLQLAPAGNSGSRVIRVEPGSRAAETSLQPGDLITAVGRKSAPTPSQIAQAFAAVSPGGSLIIAFTRGEEHRLAAIRKMTSEGR